MNIQINTKDKTIKLAETVSLKELEEVLLKFFPNNEWKEYSLETNTVIYNWSSPIVIDRYVPSYPYYNSKIFVGTSCGSSKSDVDVPTITTNQPGLYNFSTN